MFKHKPRFMWFGNRAFLFSDWRWFRVYAYDPKFSYSAKCEMGRIGKTIVMMQPVWDSIVNAPLLFDTQSDL